MSANHEEAVSILKRRFGNKQLINKMPHGDFASTRAFTFQVILRSYNTFMTVEFHVRGLNSLAMSAESYGT